MEQELLTTSEVIAILKITRHTLLRWIREGKIQGVRIGREWRFRREDLERIIAKGVTA